MIYGRSIDHKAIVPLIFRLPQQPDFSVDFAINTGFNPSRQIQAAIAELQIRTNS